MHDTTSAALNAFQISHFCLLPSCFPCPNLTQHERDHRSPTALEEEMGSFSVSLETEQ